MIYTKLTKRAMKIAYNAHMNQFDRAGVPYIYHPIHLAEQVDTEIECVVCLLHDVIEDSDISIDDLEKEFPSEVIEAIKLLTRDKRETYIEYIRKIKSSDLAVKIKILDIKHNLCEDRLDKIKIKDIVLKEKYKLALKILEE